MRKFLEVTGGKTGRSSGGGGTFCPPPPILNRVNFEKTKVNFTKKDD